MRRTVIKLGRATPWRASNVVGAMALLGISAVVVTAARGSSWWSPVAAGLCGLVAFGAVVSMVRAVIGPRSLVLDDDSMRMRDVMRELDGQVLVGRASIVGVALLPPSGRDDPSHDDVPTPNLRLNLAAGAQLRQNRLFGLIKRPVDEHVRRRVVTADSIDVDARLPDRAYTEILAWISSGPAVVAARGLVLTRLARLFAAAARPR